MKKLCPANITYVLLTCTAILLYTTVCGATTTFFHLRVVDTNFSGSMSVSPFSPKRTNSKTQSKLTPKQHKGMIE